MSSELRANLPPSIPSEEGGCAFSHESQPSEGSAARAENVATDEIAIRVTNLSKCYHIYDRPQDRLKQSIVPRLQRLIGRSPTQYAREFWALKDVSFEVKKGETVGIIGRNGSGKSTLLQMICGTLTPTSGTIETRGRVAALLELGAGFNPEFTGRENVYMNGAVLGLSKEEIDVRFDDIAAFADIGEFIEQPAKTYSSGMYVRLAFAVVAHVDADILVIDEALSVGDALFSLKCMRFLREFMQTGTIFFVSHDMGAVRNLCRDALWLERGKIRGIGGAKTLVDAYVTSLYGASQDVDGAFTTRLEGSPSLRADCTPIKGSKRDARQDIINASVLRNDIELFIFDEEAYRWGDGDAKVTGIEFKDVNGHNLSWIMGGEDVVIAIRGISNIALDSLIIGFIVRDRLGQPLFGDNTYLSYFDSPVSVREGQVFLGTFRFQMPILPAGNYSLTVALASGTQQDHVIHDWINDALVITSHNVATVQGLVGVPIQEILIEVR